MASTPNPPKRTIKDNISTSLQEKLTNFQSEQASAIESNRQNNLSAINAVAAVGRAQTDANYKTTLTPEILRTYANAVETFAQKRGITPAGENGVFTEDQKTKEFTPEEMIHFFSKDLIDSAKSDKERESFKADIDTSIKDVYEDTPVPESITKSVYNYLSDEMILSMTDEEREEEFKKDPTLSNRYDEIKSSNQEDLERNAGRADTMRDPDWGHDKGDDNFKIEQGDIIEYLMKEVILSSAAWAGNRTAGFVGTFAYELGASIHHECLPGYRKARNSIDKWWENLWADTSLSSEEIKKRKNTLTDLLGQGEVEKERLKDILPKEKNSEEEKQVDQIIRKLQSHYLVLEDDGVLLPCKKGEGVNSPDRKKSYKDFDLKANEEEAKKIAEILGKKLENFSSETVDGKTLYTIDGKTYLQHLQKQSDIQKIEEMKAFLPDEDPKKIEEWVTAYYKTKEEGVRNNDDSKIIKMQKENPSYFIALSYGKTINQYNAQSEYFSITYSQFMLLEEYRKNPESDLLGDPKKLEIFMNKSKLEAQAIFHSKHKERQDPKKKASVPSINAMIEQMEKLVEKSDEALKKGSKEKIENPYSKQRPKSQKKAESIVNAAKEESVEDFLEGIKNNLDREEQELKFAHGENSKKRDSVRELRERLFGKKGKENEFKNEIPRTGLNQYTVSGGRKS